MIDFYVQNNSLDLFNKLKIQRNPYCSEKLCFQCSGQLLPNETSNGINSIRICNLHHVHYFPFARKSYCFGNEFLDDQWSFNFHHQYCVSIPSLPPELARWKNRKQGTSKKPKYKTKRQHTLSKLESESMDLRPSTNFELRTNVLFCWWSATSWSISFRASTCPASQLNRKMTGKKSFNRYYTELTFKLLLYKYTPVELIGIIGKKEK